MAKSRDPRNLGPLADKLLVAAGELVLGADGLSAKDEKRLNELLRRGRAKGLTAGERAQVVRLAYKAVPDERVDDLKRLLKHLGGGARAPKTRWRLKK